MKFIDFLKFENIKELQKQYETGEFPYFFCVPSLNDNPISWGIYDGEILVERVQNSSPSLDDLKRSAIAITDDAVPAEFICRAAILYQRIAREQIKRRLAEGNHVIN